MKKTNSGTVDKNPALSIIIVTYNSSDVILDCIRSLPGDSISTQTLIIDNHSSDKTVPLIQAFIEKHYTRNITLIRQAVNLGYANGVNTGLKKCRGDFIMLLGPDARLKTGSAETLISALNDRTGAGMAAPRLISESGRTHHSIRTFPGIQDLLIELSGLPKIFPNRISPPWKLKDFDYTQPSEIDQPEASCIICKKEAVAQIGLMDERFQMFFNDVDWCRRFKENGWEILFRPEAEVIHLRGTSIYSNRVKMIWKSHQGFYRYLGKYGTPASRLIIVPLSGLLLLITAVLRSVIWIVQNIFNKINR